VSVEIQAPGGGAIPATAVVTRCQADGPGFRVGAEFTGLSAESERRLILLLFQRLAPETVHGRPGEPRPEAAAA
jgi:hypothetical protein